MFEKKYLYHLFGYYMMMDNHKQEQYLIQKILRIFEYKQIPLSSTACLIDISVMRASIMKGF